MRCVLPRKGTGKTRDASRGGATRKERNAASALSGKNPKGATCLGELPRYESGGKTSSLDPDSRLALHPKQGKLALMPIDEMSSRNISPIILKTWPEAEPFPRPLSRGNAMYMKNVRSEAMDSVGYNAETRTLYIHFTKDSKITQFPGVPMHLYEGLMATVHKGEYFAEHIRDRYQPA